MPMKISRVKRTAFCSSFGKGDGLGPFKQLLSVFCFIQ